MTRLQDSPLVVSDTVPDIHLGGPRAPFVRCDCLVKSVSGDLEKDLEKSTFGEERPGHKYISRRLKAGGGWEYEYAEAHAGRGGA
jgi:hypothetical protein